MRELVKAWLQRHSCMQLPLLWVRDAIRQIRSWGEDRHSRKTSHAVDRPLLEIAIEERQELIAARRSCTAPYRRPFDPPLISVVIATYNRSEILTQRTLPALLCQDYPHLEIIIVGDGCTDDTMQRLAQMNDARIRFENLAERGKYPDAREARHMVSGVPPINRAMALAQGDWIAHCDDDELFTSKHVLQLWEHAERYAYEYVWAQQLQEVAPGNWIQQGTSALHRFDIPHSTLLYRTYLRCFQYDIESWKFGLGADRHRLRRMRLAGVRCGFLSKVVTLAPLRPFTTRPWAEAEDRD